MKVKIQLNDLVALKNRLRAAELINGVNERTLGSIENALTEKDRAIELSAKANIGLTAACLEYSETLKGIRSAAIMWGEVTDQQLVDCIRFTFEGRSKQYHQLKAETDKQTCRAERLRDKNKKLKRKLKKTKA